MLNQPDITGTVLQHRINEATQGTFERHAAYKLKSTSTLNRNINLYSAEQLEYIKTELKEFNYFFGYATNEADSNKMTSFFTYEDVTAEDLVNYKGFIKHNDSVMSQLGSDD